LGIITTNIDDVGHTALDEATKRAEVNVVYARSFYAGASNASGPLSGEFIGIISGPTPDEVISGIEAARNTIENDTFFEALNHEGTHSLYVMWLLEQENIFLNWLVFERVNHWHI
jgi:ethanolamine utilization protein EutL